MASIRYSVPGESRIQDLTISQTEISIGRVEGNAVVLKDDGVSRLHARIKLTEKGYVVEDNKSANGTWLNGKKVTEAPLSDGDEIMIGKTVLLFSDRMDPEATVRFNVARPMPAAGSAPQKSVPLLSPASGGEASKPTATIPSPPARRATSINPGKITSVTQPRLYAGFWIRFFAYILDSIFVTILMGIVLIPAAFLTILTRENLPLTIAVAALGAFLSTALGFFYVLYYWAKKGATIGKRICGLKIVREHSNEPLGYRRASIRLLGYMLSNLSFYIGFIMIAFTDKKRGLHDYIAGTLVIKN